MGVQFLSTSLWGGCPDDPHQSRSHRHDSSHQNGSGETSREVTLQTSGHLSESSGALQAERKQQGRAELQHKALLHSWSQALGPANLHTVCFHRPPHTLPLQLAVSWEGQEQATRVPSHRFSTETPAPTFILWSSTSSTLATRMKEGVLLSTASSFMLTRKLWGGR